MSNLRNKLHQTVSPQLAVAGDHNTFPIVTVPLAGNKKVNFLESQLVSPNIVALNHMQKNDVVVYPVTATSTSDFENGAQTDLRFDAPNGHGMMMTNLRLQWNLMNGDSGNQQAVPAPMQIAKVQFLFNNSGVVAWEQQDISIYHGRYIDMSTEEFTSKATVQNISTSTWNTAGNIATTATSYQYVDLDGPWKYVPVPVLFKSMTVRVFWAGATAGLVSTGNNDGVLQLVANSLKMRIEHFEISQEEADIFRKNFIQKGGLSILFLTDQYERQTQTLSNSSTYTLLLNSIKGQAPEVDFCFRTSLAGASSGSTTLKELVSTYEFLNSDGSSMSGGQAYEGNYNLRVLGSEYFRGNFLNTKAFYTHCFVPRGAKAIQDVGKRIGGQVFDRSQLRFTTDASTAGGNSHYIDIIAKIYSTITFLPDGQVIVHRG